MNELYLHFVFERRKQGVKIGNAGRKVIKLNLHYFLIEEGM
jgi:hypothetical protein